MHSDYTPIIYNIDSSMPEAEVYFAHDIHMGNNTCSEDKWSAFKKQILDKPNRFLIMVGDYCENAVIDSKSDIYTQTMPPYAQKEWLSEQMIELKDRIIAIVPGNHEDNRITRTCGLYPVYDCAKDAGLQNLYRHNFAIVDIGVGDAKHGKNSHKQIRYFGYIVHRLRDARMYNGADFVDGIDFAVYGHDHDPKDHPRSKLVYDSKNKTIAQKNIEVINSGSFMNYGGYATKAGYRPLSSKCYKMVLSDKREKDIMTVGFYL